MLTAPEHATVLFRTSSTADPAGEPLAVAVRHGRGRVVVVADSDLFGDDSIGDYDHAALWGNLVTWVARVPPRRRPGSRRPRPPSRGSRRPWRRSSRYRPRTAPSRAIATGRWS
ncbi:hypothetical protein ACFQX6_25220 [Streptosporangium lutulentum]